MKAVIIVALLSLFIPVYVAAQANQPIDSLRYYYLELNGLRSKTLDSLENTAQYKQLKQSIDRQMQKNNNYSGFILGAEIMHSDVTDFNKSIVASGFPSLKPMSVRLSVGVGSKMGRKMFDVYFAIAGLNNKSKKGDEVIKLNLASFFQANLGYDLLNSRYFSIYPYGGLSVRTSNLIYKKPAEVNGTYTNISNIITNDQSVKAASTRVGYQLGIGFDALLSKDEGIIFYTKFATDRTFGSHTFDIDGTKYNPGIKQGDWLVALGFKLIPVR